MWKNGAVDRSPNALSRRMDDFARQCRAKGRSVTPQRLAIYRALLAATDHPGPEALFERLHGEMPSLSLATVYKTLDTLVDLGAVHEVFGAGTEKRYDANLERHHHLVCERCGRIDDVYEPRFDRLKPPRRLRGFRARDVRVQIGGVCARCRRG